MHAAPPPVLYASRRTGEREIRTALVRLASTPAGAENMGAREPVGKPVPMLAAVSLLLLAAVALTTAAWSPGYVIGRGVVREAGQGGLVMTAVQVRPATFVDAVRAQLDHTVRLRSKRDSVRSLDTSVDNAVAAAGRLLLVEPARLGRPHVDLQGLAGPSGGLVMALDVVDRYEGGRLLRGRRVAGTGAILPDGRVLAVGQVAAKVVAAERAGVELFLVPIQNIGEARRAASGMRVVGIRTLADAVAVLNGS